RLPRGRDLERAAGAGLGCIEDGIDRVAPGVAIAHALAERIERIGYLAHEMLLKERQQPLGHMAEADDVAEHDRVQLARHVAVFPGGEHARSVLRGDRMAPRAWNRGTRR